MKIRLLSLLPALFMLIMGVCSQAEAFSNPISWNDMDMPSVTYDPVANKLAAELPFSIATLGTNTAANGVPSAAGIGSFDPAQPWNLLNGAAFSRRIGWNDPNYAYADIPANDPSSIIYTIKSIYGPGAGVWIDCTNKSPGLNNYLAVGQWGVNADGSQIVDPGNATGYPYSGIFGTTYLDFVTKEVIVSSTKWQWDGMMDHNVNTVAFGSLTAPSQLFSADYRVYIGDAAGNELRLDSGGGVHVAGAAGFDLLPSADATVTWQWKGPAFVFTSQTSVPTYAVVESDALKISGITGTKPISITGGEYAISTVTSTTTAPATWGVWSSAPSTITNNYWVKVRQTAASTPSTLTIATLAIPAIPGPGEFRVTTAAVVNVPVPNVVGTPQAAAQSTITAATLSVGSITTAYDAGIPAGSVISQSPVAGSLVAPGTAVDLVVSTGPAPVAVPNVVNLTQANAQSFIIAATLTVGTVTQAFSATVPSGSVISQTPVAGTSVLPGTAVNLAVSTGDSIPDGFGFTSLTGVAPATVYESNAITVTGVNVSAPISISTGGSYAVSTDSGSTWGSWLTAAGTISANNQVKVRRTSASTPTTEVITTLTIGGVTGNFSLTTNSYTAPPTWMPMTMLNISLTGGKLAIVELATKSPFNTTPPTYPVLSTVAPAGTFDPAKPWAILNGTAYSRRLGWNPASGFNAVAVQTAFGSNAAIWIERISASPGLQTYQAIGTYGVNSNGTTTIDPAANGYAPIFGTAGSSIRWKWDYLMDHNVNAVPAAYITQANQHFSATYRIYVGDNVTGTDIAPAAAYTTTWGWTGPATVPVQQITVTSSPAGRSFSVDGVTYSSSQTFSWAQGSSHAIATTSPQAGTAGTRYTFTSWSDSGAPNHTIIVPSATTTYTANFSTEYLLTTTASPVVAGTVSPISGTWYPAGTIVPVKAFTNAGYSFVSWNGLVANSNNVATTVTMSGPQTITANLAGSPLLSAAISGKSGTAASTRIWNITVSNSGQTTATSARITGLVLTQTFGSACFPVLTTPIPVGLGDIAVGGSATEAVTIDFSSCAATARFTATISYGSNSGTVTGSKGYANQFR